MKARQAKKILLALLKTTEVLTIPRGSALAVRVRKGASINRADDVAKMIGMPVILIDETIGELTVIRQDEEEEH